MLVWFVMSLVAYWSDLTINTTIRNTAIRINSNLMEFTPWLGHN